MTEGHRERRRIHAPARWERVWLGDGEGQAAIVAGALEARAIDTRVHGGRPIPEAYPSAWARANWAVFVRSRDALHAREYLRDTGEAANVVDDQQPVDRERLFSLKLALTGILALVIISAIGVLFYGWGV